MPRKRKVALKNQKSISSRWNKTRPTIPPPEVPSSSEESAEEDPILDELEGNTGENPPISSRPTGFALYDSYRNVITENDDAPQYGIVDIKLFSAFLCMFACPSCQSTSLSVKNNTFLGYVMVLRLFCESCKAEFKFESSRRIQPNVETKSTRPPFDVNRRVVSAFVYMGKGYRGLESFSMCMNMKPMQNFAFHKHKNALCKIVEQNVKTSLNEARCEVRKVCSELDDIENPNKPIDICVSYDGSWHKRGFTSKYGIGCCIEVTTGLVLDFEVLSKFCNLCNKNKTLLGSDSEEFRAWFEVHKPNCNSNYEGSSPAMEMVAAERIWRRSETYNFRYTTVVSDGDAKAFSHLHEIGIYENTPLQKIECLNHVAKRLGTALRKAVTEHRKSEKPLGGKSFGSLTSSTINKLTSYYRNAVQNNFASVKNMKVAIFATLDHCSSTDEKPKHGKCPKGKESWCFYQRAIALDKTPEHHKDMIKTPLSENVVAKILPIYIRLTSDSLLEKCVTGKTQNANEALHQVIWAKCPKTVFVSKKLVELAVGQAICEYNTGRLKAVTQMQHLSGVSPGKFTVKIAKNIDKKRLQLAKRRKENKYEEYRKKRKTALLREEERRKQQEGTTYGAGEF